MGKRFFAAAEQGDLRALESLPAQDVALHGGGKVPALAPLPINGWERVARTLWDAFTRFGLRNQVAEVNGQPCVRTSA